MHHKTATRINTMLIAEKHQLEPEVTKKKVLDNIREVASIASENQTTELYIYFTGNGHQETGAWKVYGETTNEKEL